MTKTPKQRFPWLLFLLLAGSVYAFWFSPLHKEPGPVKVEAGKTSNP